MSAPARARWRLQAVTPEDLAAYARDDKVQGRLAAVAQPWESALTCQKWLLDSPPKRMIFERLYGDLFARSGLRILDVGGGLTSFSRVLASRHDYLLAELLAHGGDETTRRFLESAGPLRLHQADWTGVDAALPPFDLVIANDLFPNVDQRLELFLSSFSGRARELRLSLTYFESPRYYFARRVDGEEILCMLQWDAAQLRHALERAAGDAVVDGLQALDRPGRSIFPNGRQVALLTVERGTA